MKYFFFAKKKQKTLAPFIAMSATTAAERRDGCH
jgi:hypothetical protein